MDRHVAIIAASLILAAITPAISASAGSEADSAQADPIKVLVGRLDLDRYKATIKGLTQFGDRRQGTDRNSAAVTWIESKLKSYGCSDVSRLKYTYFPTDAQRPSGPPVARNADISVGGARYRGVRARTGVNEDPVLQPDEKLRALNSQPSQGGSREEVYCTKIGATHPDEMYIVGAHMDGHGWGEAANDDGSGTALVMELARILSAPDVKTDRSIRFTSPDSTPPGPTSTNVRTPSPTSACTDWVNRTGAVTCSISRPGTRSAVSSLLETVDMKRVFSSPKWAARRAGSSLWAASSTSGL